MKGIKPLVLVILDGWGIAPPGKGNAVSLAKKPFWDHISVSYPHTSLLASGEEVGLPKGEAGNSQVGHLNIGAGKIVYQELPRINTAISDGSFLKKPAFLAAAEHVKKNKSNLHVLGLVGRGSVHSSLEHLYAVLWFAKSQGLKDVFLHVFTDGRDSPPTSGLGVIKEIVAKSSQIGVGWLSSICGRYYAMDRNKRWERTSICYEALVQGVGDKVKEPIAAVRELYEKGVTDEFIKPLLTAEEGELVHTIKDGDSVIFFNFRPDRARQLTRSLVDPTFSDFVRKTTLKNILFVSMTEYEKNLPVLTAFPPLVLEYPLAAVLSSYDQRQLHIGETEK
jgi:2,3-bisphosphoglycerate-independent phosphoglycerate mutase